MTRDHISVKYKLDHICIFLPKVSCRGNHLRFTTVMLVNKNTVTHLFIFELKDLIQILRFHLNIAMLKIIILPSFSNVFVALGKDNENRPLSKIPQTALLNDTVKGNCYVKNEMTFIYHKTYNAYAS